VDREQERRKQVCVVLDQRGLRGEPLERAVEFAAALVTRELDAGAEVSLALAGEFLPGASGGAQGYVALRKLALVQPGEGFRASRTRRPWSSRCARTGASGDQAGAGR
jgi:uncharacterized protein (DUF58 family)